MGNELKITISGTTASGKSRMSYLLKTLLRTWGFDVTMVDDVDFKSEQHFDDIMGTNLDIVMDDFVKNKKISITTQTEVRENV